MPAKLVASSSQYISYGNTLNQSGSFSVTGWIKTTSATGKPLAKYYAGGDYIPSGFVIQVSTNTISMTVGHGSTAYNRSYLIGNTVITDGAWHHFVLMWNSSTKQADCYIDGAQSLGSSEYKNLAMASTTEPLTIGRLNYAGAYSYTDGEYDDIRMYDRLLTATEIRFMAENRLRDCVYSGLVFRQTFGIQTDQSSLPSTITDDMGHTGTCYGTPIWTADNLKQHSRKR